MLGIFEILDIWVEGEKCVQAAVRAIVIDENFWSNSDAQHL
jgi:hypothetical protein